MAPFDVTVRGTEVVTALGEPLTKTVTTLGTRDEAESLPDPEPAEATPPAPESPCSGELLVTDISEEIVVGDPFTVVVNTVVTAEVTTAPPALGRVSVASPDPELADGRNTDALPLAVKPRFSPKFTRVALFQKSSCRLTTRNSCES